MEEGLLSLKWNNHKSTFFQVLSVLHGKHTYADVTLACDGRLYPAHKFVLSTCSEYFSDIFTSTSGSSIVIVLKDVRRQDLEYLMDYMYLGQVDVAQSELSSLIKTAECLRIKGLAIPDDEPHKTSRGSAKEQEGSSPPSKKKRYLQEDDRPLTTTTTTTDSNISTTSSPSLLSTSTPVRLQLEMLSPPSDLGSLAQHLRQAPLPHSPLQVPPLPPPTTQGSIKGHSSQPLTLSLPTQALRLSHGISSGSHSVTPSTTQASNPSFSPTHPTSIPVIKEEATDPPETPEGYVMESFEENETKPNVSDPKHLEHDGAVAGPSGLQRSTESWDGEGDMAGYSTGESYSEGGLEEQGESEVQGERNVGDSASYQARRIDVGSTSTSTKVSPTIPIFTHTSDSALASLTPHIRHVDSSHQREQGRMFLDGIVEPQSGISPNGASFPEAKISLRHEGANMEISTSRGREDSGTERSMVSSQMLHPFQDPRECPWCHKVLSKASNLKVHIRRHTGEKPYHCLFCPYMAAQKIQVINHMNARHQTAPNTFL